MSATINVEASKKSTEVAKKVLREKNYLKMKNSKIPFNVRLFSVNVCFQLNVCYVVNSSATMCAMTELSDLSFRDSRRYSGLGKCYQTQPSAWADNTYLAFHKGKILWSPAT